MLARAENGWASADRSHGLPNLSASASRARQWGRSVLTTRTAEGTYHDATSTAADPGHTWIGFVYLPTGSMADEDPYDLPERQLVDLGEGWYSFSGRLIGGNVADWRRGHR